jgi:hypothetical protein
MVYVDTSVQELQEDEADGAVIDATDADREHLRHEFLSNAFARDEVLLPLASPRQP